MAITQAMTTQFKIDILSGTFLPAHTLKVALYTSTATLDASTTIYTTSNEVVGTGYTAGGTAVTVTTSPTNGGSGTTAYLSFSNPSWTTATITARGAMIYDVTNSNHAIAILNFGTDQTSTAGTFTVQMPTADATNAIIRIA
jgi:VCBS repeat-containing protein